MCDLTEKDLEDEPLSFADGVITATIKPYEILTFRLR